MKRPPSLLLAVCCCIIGILKAQAQPAGSLDPTFANAGIGRYQVGNTYINASDDARKVLLQPDGKIILAGGTAGVRSFQ